MPSTWLRIAGLTFCMQWNGDLLYAGNPGWDDSFRVGAGPAACTIRIRQGEPMRWWKSGAKDWVFSSNGLWAAFRREDGWGFVSPAPDAGQWRRLLVWLPRREQADLWLHPSLSYPVAAGGHSRFDPIQHLTLPFFTAFFAYHQGILVHAAAVEVDGGAWVFAGRSGSGKSHWTRQWQGRGLAVLDEDRVVLRQLDGQVWAFGTPWHPEPRLCSPHGAPVERIFFLRQAESDAVQEIRPAAAATSLLRSSQLPVYDPGWTQAVLDVAGQAATQARSFFVGRMTDAELLDRLMVL